MISLKYNIIIEGKPTAKARPRFCRRGEYIGTYKQKGEQGLEDIFKYEAKEQLLMQGLTDTLPLDAKIKLSLYFQFEAPASYSKKKKEAMRGMYHMNKPDIDNLLKFYLDGLNGILYKDDSQICRLQEVYKIWAETAMTVIMVETL